MKLKKNLTLLYFFFSLAVALFSSPTSWGAGVTVAKPETESISIPLRTPQRPASDLVDSDGGVLDVADLLRRQRAGEDLSLLNPLDNKLYRQIPAAPRDFAVSEFVPDSPENNSRALDFDSLEATPPFTYLARVRVGGEIYRLGLSRFAQPAMMRAKLLRKIGYYAPMPTYYRRLVIRFAKAEDMNTFITRAERATVTDFYERKWVIGRDETTATVVLSSAMLEPLSSDVFDAHWGYAPSARRASQEPIVNRYNRYRSWRALLIPFVLLDVPESINRFSPRLCSIYAGSVVLNHPYAKSFRNITWEDARWVLRRIGKLSESDWREIVADSGYPADLEPLVHGLIMHRLQDAMECFEVRPDNKLAAPDLEKFNSESGLVVAGKVMRNVEGYPQRFAHGDRKAPFEDGDLARYLMIDFKSTALKEALARLNQKLTIRNPSDVAAKRAQEVAARVDEHIRTRPWEPLYQKIEPWGGPVGGASVDAQRFVSTGAYYGSSANLQLVDSLSVSASIGYFMGLDGFVKIQPSAMGNVSLIRSYLHVRPLESLKQAEDENWQKLYVPSVMGELGTILAGEDEKKPEDPARAIERFLAKLRLGEVFTISDTLAMGVGAQISAPLSVLLGTSPLSFINSIAFGFDANRIQLGQTSFLRTKEGIQVLVRDQRSNAYGAQFDFNYFLNLLRARAQRLDTKLYTDAFVVDYSALLSQAVLDPKPGTNPKMAKEIEKFKKLQEDLETALGALFTHNSTEFLYSKFGHKQFKIEHDLGTDEAKLKFLALKASQFRENHNLKLRFPPDPERPELKPEDEEIEIFAHRRGELVGRDLLGFFMDILDGLIMKSKLQASGFSRDQSPNPANAPFGRAYWRVVRAEVDLSKPDTTNNRKSLPPMASVQHVWGGWSLSRQRFFTLVDEIEGGLKESGLINVPLIKKEEFAKVKSIDFYRLTANLSILKGGLDKIRQLVLQPTKRGEVAPEQARNLLGRIIFAMSGDPANRAGDAEMFNQFMAIVGEGDASKGRLRYLRSCEEEKRRQHLNGEVGSQYNGEWRYGTYYQCLTGWLADLLDLAREYPQGDLRKQTKWTAEVLAVLDRHVPIAALLKYLGQGNFLFFVRLNGFRVADEDGDLEFFSNSVGEPPNGFDEAGGLMAYWARASRVSPFEIERTQGEYR